MTEQTNGPKQGARITHDGWEAWRDVVMVDKEMFDRLRDALVRFELNDDGDAEALADAVANLLGDT